METKKVYEWIYRIFCLSIIDSFIVVIGFVGTYTFMNVLIETNNLNWKTQIGLIQHH